MNTNTSFASLSKEHVELDRLFNKHQRALIERDLDTALAALKAFGRGLKRHIEFEEQRVLPLYADQGAEIPGGTLEIFLAEHRKLRDDFANLTQLAVGLKSANDLVGSIVTLLDKEAGFKGLFHHHAAREQILLFPRLDERSTEEERKTWLSTHDE